MKNNSPEYLLLLDWDPLDYVKITIYSTEATVWLPVSQDAHKGPVIDPKSDLRL